MNRRRHESEAPGRNSGRREELQVPVDDLAPHDAHQHAAFAQRRPAEQHLLVAVRVDALQLESDGRLYVFGFDAAQHNLAHDHFLPRQ